jgi:outer membrane protein OmpA-like peptidoglycan-associated protein
MKKRIIALMLSGILAQPVLADDQVESLDKQSLKHTASGVLIGGILAGPPGMLIGMAGGALIGEINKSEQQVSTLQQKVAQQQTALVQEQRQTAQRHQQLKSLLESKQTRLSAMQDGFSFCLGFRTDSAEIEPKISDQLISIATMLQAFPELKLKILAGADKRGSDKYNKVLSEARAQAVAGQLIAAGLPEARISIHYVGHEHAIYALDDAEGLSFDRMVQLTLVKGDAS